MKKWIAVLGCAAVCLFIAIGASAAEAGAYVTGSIVTMGTYDQDNDPGNGKEPVEWIVLDADAGRALLISRYCLDAHPYNTDFVPMTWEKCTLRTWLNDTLLNGLFTADEQASILPVAVVNENNPYYGTYGGHDTEDRIFLLSIAEAHRYFPTDKDRQAQPTAYAIARGAYLNVDSGNTWWWLRTAGVRRIDASGVRQDGKISGYGSRDVYRPSGAVRPVLWIATGESN